MLNACQVQTLCKAMGTKSSAEWAQALAPWGFQFTEGDQQKGDPVRVACALKERCDNSMKNPVREVRARFLRTPGFS